MKNIRFLKLLILFVILSAGLMIVTVSAFGQQRPALTASDYARAEKLLGYNTNPLVFRSGVHATWLPDERFWYRITTAEGSEFVLVDPAKGTRAPAFDHAALATALSAAAQTTYEAH